MISLLLDTDTSIRRDNKLITLLATMARKLAIGLALLNYND